MTLAGTRNTDLQQQTDHSQRAVEAIRKGAGAEKAREETGVWGGAGEGAVGNSSGTHLDRMTR